MDALRKLRAFSPIVAGRPRAAWPGRTCRGLHPQTGFWRILTTVAQIWSFPPRVDTGCTRKWTSITRAAGVPARIETGCHRIWTVPARRDASNMKTSNRCARAALSCLMAATLPARRATPNPRVRQAIPAERVPASRAIHVLGGISLMSPWRPNLPANIDVANQAGASCHPAGTHTIFQRRPVETFEAHPLPPYGHHAQELSHRFRVPQMKGNLWHPESAENSRVKAQKPVSANSLLHSARVEERDGKRRRSSAKPPFNIGKWYQTLSYRQAGGTFSPGPTAQIMTKPRGQG